MANESGFLAKPVACVTVAGVACQGLWAKDVSVWQLPADGTCVVSGTGLEWSTGVGESPVRECHVLCLVFIARVAAGSWNLL